MTTTVVTSSGNYTWTNDYGNEVVDSVAWHEFVDAWTMHGTGNAYGVFDDGDEDLVSVK